ncbi:MAG: zinc ribbon domain-containing protein [Anaerolineae bacterium]|jgi:RNA polymerase subunit RPABC4/transcription elongation factor Spt4
MDFEQILRTIQPFLIMLAALLAAFLTAMWISFVIWTFRDIRSRSRDIFAQILATLMVFLFFPFFPFPGLALYLLLRPRETLAEIYERSLEEEALLQGIEERLACPGCNRRIEETFMICPTCHTRLKKACPACGQLLHLRWNICPYCGAVQTAVKTVPPPAEPVSLAVEPDGGRLEQRVPAALSEPEAEVEKAPPSEPEAEGEEALPSEPEAEAEEAPPSELPGEPATDRESADERSEPQAETLPFDFD